MRCSPSSSALRRRPWSPAQGGGTRLPSALVPLPMPVSSHPILSGCEPLSPLVWQKHGRVPFSRPEALPLRPATRWRPCCRLVWQDRGSTACAVPASLRPGQPGQAPLLAGCARASHTPLMPPPLLLLQDIHLTLGGTTPLLAGAELAVGAGERICLVGHNGSGKSTLLKVAAGMLAADRGDAVRAAGDHGALPAAGAGPGRVRGRGGLRGSGAGAERRPLSRAGAAGPAGAGRDGASVHPVRRAGAAGGAGPHAGAGAGPAAAGRADQPPGPAGDRVAGSGARRRCAPGSC